MEQQHIHNVLIVDDDETLLASWKRIVARTRSVETANDADTARQLARCRTFDLLVVDLRLGDTSGIELIRELRPGQPDARIVLCSGYLSVATAIAAVKAGATTVVFKPVTFREILQSLEWSDHATTDLEETPTLARAEWEHIMRVLTDCNGNISMAARKLGIYRSSLQRRLKKLPPRK